MERPSRLYGSTRTGAGARRGARAAARAHQLPLADCYGALAKRRTQRDHHALLIFATARGRKSFQIQGFETGRGGLRSRLREPFRRAPRPMPGCEADASPLEPWREPMSRKFIVAIAAVAAIGMSTLASTDAFARGGGHGGGGGGGRGGHVSMSHGGGFHRS